MTEIVAIGLTLCLEAVACAVYVRLRSGVRVGLPAVLVACTIASCLTHPAAWTLNAIWSPSLGAWQTLVLLEVIVVVVEWVVYRVALSLSWRQALEMSALANGLSVGVGLLVEAWIFP